MKSYTQGDDDQLPLEMMKFRIDNKFRKIMSILNAKHNLAMTHRRTQTDPNQSAKDDSSTFMESKQPNLSEKLIIPGFPLTSRNQASFKPKILNKTYTSRPNLPKKRASINQFNTTSSTVNEKSVDIAKIDLDVKLQKRIPKQDQNIKKKKSEQPQIIMPRVQTSSEMTIKMKGQIQKNFYKSREENQDNYIRRLRLLERIAKLTQKPIKK